MDEKKVEGCSDSDWYNESDTSDDIPDPSNCNSRLFQDINSLPVELKKKHFQEGISIS